MYSNRDLYVQFRTEVETMYAPHVLNELSECIPIQDNNHFRTVGLLMVKDKYVVGLYIIPQYRRKGLATKAVLKYIEKYGMLKDLTILNSNKVALKFWNRLFELKVIKNNGIDTWYEIVGLRG